MEEKHIGNGDWMVLCMQHSHLPKVPNPCLLCPPSLIAMIALRRREQAERWGLEDGRADKASEPVGPVAGPDWGKGS